MLPRALLEAPAFLNSGMDERAAALYPFSKAA